MSSLCPTDLSERALLVHHVAKRLGVSCRTVRYWAATGRLRAHKDGPKIWKFTLADVELARRLGVGNDRP